jgi:5-methylcytosine-specific restriction endonuclease McrA
VIRVYEKAGNVIETYKQAGELCSRTPMNEAEYTASEASFAAHLRWLRLNRRQRKKAARSSRTARQPLSTSQRAHILAKTAGRCHICGGLISESTWHADHVLAHSAGGAHIADNYLPAHALCNNYRWDYSAEEFQHILKLGVWTRTQIERRTGFGRDAAAAFLAYDRTRQARRASAISSSRSKT